MRKLLVACLATFVAALLVAAGDGASIVAQEKKANPAQKGIPPKFLYGHDVRVRHGGHPDFDKDTPRIGVEVFEDEGSNAIVAISESGSIAVVPAGPIGMDKSFKWLTAHDLSARKAGEVEFTQKTKKYGVELFRDVGSNHLLYVCETGSIAFASVPATLVTDRGPKWQHAFEQRIRSPEQATFENAKKMGVEVFKDENTDGLIYITESGGIATALPPATPSDPKNVTPPKSAYGLILRVRGANEPDFNDKTKVIPVEVYEDQKAGTLFYITEAGYLATVPNPGKFANAKGVTWKSAIALKARKGGEKSFDLAKKFGIEVFVDNRTGNLIFISETGSIAVLPKQ